METTPLSGAPPPTARVPERLAISRPTCASVFFSYASFDDRDQRLSDIRERLEGELRAVSGRKLRIFQDRVDVHWGQAWRNAIDESLDSSSILLPVVTPSFLRSAECRREVLLFRGKEDRLRRSDLILPLYYIDCEQLEDPSVPVENEDGVIALFRERHRLDARFIRDLSVASDESERFRQFINRAARQLYSAIDRDSPADGPGPEDGCPRITTVAAETQAVSIPDEDFGHYWLQEADGRDRERDTLTNLIAGRNSHFVALHGAAGIGKTTLAMAVVRQLMDDNVFVRVACRSLRKPPTLEDLLVDLIPVMSSHQEALPTVELRVLMDRFRQVLKARRCLLVLDNLESLFAPGKISGEYQKEFEVYHSFLQTLSTFQHDGCVLVTTREMPRELSASEGPGRVTSVPLLGLDDRYGEAILRRAGVSQASARSIADVLRFYSGNPTALKVVATHVKGAFAGDLDRFLEEGSGPPRQYLELLADEVERLNDIEADILNWIALENGPVSARQLREDLVQQDDVVSLQDALSSLTARHLIHSANGRYQQTPALSEFVTHRLIRAVAKELADFNDVEKRSLRRCSLVRAQAKSDVQAAQRLLVHNRLVEELDRAAGGTRLARQALEDSLQVLRMHGFSRQAYGPGNIFNLVSDSESLGQSRWNLRDFDFSGLAMRQVDFGNKSLEGLDFSHSQFWRCRFIAAFRLVVSLAFGRGGQVWASGDADGDVRIWRTDDGRELFHVRHGKCVRSVAFSPDAALLASAGCDGTVKVWSIDAHDESIALRYALTRHRDWVGAVAFSPDGAQLATASDDGTVRLWSAAAGMQQHVLRGHRGQVSGVAYAPGRDRHLLATCGKDRTVRIWNSKTGAPVQRAETGAPVVLEGHQDWVWSLAFSPDGRYLASSSDDRTVRLWRTSDWTCVRTFEGHQHWVWSVAFSPDGQTMASASMDATIRLWTLDGRCRGTLRHRNPVWALAFRPHSHWLASAGEDQTVRFWDAESRECIRTLEGYSSWNRAVAFHPTSGELASAGDDRLVRIWDPSSGKAEPQRTIKGHTHWIRSVAYSPDGQTLVTASDDHTIGFWSSWSKDEPFQRLKGHSARVNTVAFSADGERLASGSDDRTIRLWNVASRTTSRVLKGHKLRVTSLAFDGPGAALVSGSHDRTVILWDPSSGRIRRRFRTTSRVEAVSISPDGRTVACGCEDQGIRLWDVDGAAAEARLQRHREWVRAMAFSPDGSVLAAGGDDGLIALWDVAAGQWVGEFSAPGAPGVSAIAFRSNGIFLATAHHDHTIRVWNVAKRELWTELHCPRPYEGLSIHAAFGLSEAERRTLRLLGAVEDRRQPARVAEPPAARAAVHARMPEDLSLVPLGDLF